MNKCLQNWLKGDKTVGLLEAGREKERSKRRFKVSSDGTELCDLVMSAADSVS